MRGELLAEHLAHMVHLLGARTPHPPTRPTHSSLARAVVARRSCACADVLHLPPAEAPSSMSPPPHTHAARGSMWPLARAPPTRPPTARSPR
eukprot:1692559-Prymnesium_polylepis.1